ncbi:hypothetical protein GCM10022236_32160 [Microlunatus ginsengisoli]|uniref:Uncharacterized protein n=1 Tax=Microlunatus ginsengisoli TaxID=363863 RepID=A0ABP7A968_9ACTN
MELSGGRDPEAIQSAAVQSIGDPDRGALSIGSRWVGVAAVEDGLHRAPESAVLVGDE